MDKSETSELPFDERRKQKPQNAMPKSLPQNVEESSQATETTATATISTLPSFSESKATQRQRYMKHILAGEASRSDSKLAGMRKEWENISPTRLFEKDTNAEAHHIEEEDREGHTALSSNDTQPTAKVSLPQEQMNDLGIAHSESSELSAETEHLRYLREKVDRQVQSMSKLLLESPSGQSQEVKPRVSARQKRLSNFQSTDAAVQQFQALSSQIVADFLEQPNEPPRIERRKERRKRASTLQLDEDVNLQLREARLEIEELQRQLTDQEQVGSVSPESSDPQVVLLHQQRSKLQRRIRELLQDTAELRQERNSFEVQCLEQVRRMHSLEESLRQLEEDKKDSEKSLYRYISALQDKSTQLLEELQETRRLLQHESQSRIEASMEAKYRIATLESEKKRLLRAVSRNAEATDFGRSKTVDETEEDQSVVPDQLVISNMDAIAGNDRIQKMKSEVQLRRAKIEALRRKRTDEGKTSPQIKNIQTPAIKNRAASPINMIAYSPSPSPRKRKIARSPMSFDGDRQDGPPGMQLFLQRIETAMEESAISFENQASAFHLQQEVLELKHENVELKLGIEEAEENAASLESAARLTVSQLQESTDREEKLTIELNEQRASAESANALLEEQEIVLKEHKQKLEDVNGQFEAVQKAYLVLQARAKKLDGLEQGHSTLQDVIESHKAQNRAMSSQIDALEMTVVDLEMENGSLQNRLVVLEGDLKQQEGLVAKLSSDLGASSGREASTRKELETAVQDRSELQSKIQSISVELEEAQKNRNSLEHNVEELKSTVSAAEENQLVMTKKLEANETDLTRIKLESGSLTQELDTIQQAMKNLRTEKAAQALALKHAEQVQNELASRLAASELALKEQAQAFMLQDEEVSRLVEKCLGIKSDSSSTLTTDSGSPSVPPTPRSQKRQQLETKLKLEVAETSERRSVLERQLRDLHSQFQSLRQGEENSEAHLTGLGKNLHLRSLDAAIGRLREECDELSSKNARLQDQFFAMKQLVSDSETLRQELEKIISEREQELERLREANVLMGAEAATLQSDQQQLAAENEVYAKIQEELERRLADATRLIDSTLPRIKELESKVEDLNKEVAGRDIVMKGINKENTELTDQVKALNDSVEFWVKKCKDLEPTGEAIKEESKKSGEDSHDLIKKVTEQLEQLSDIKAEVMKQLFRTAGSVDYKSANEEPVAKAAGNVLADIQDLHYVLDTVRQFIVASREATMHLDRAIESLRDEKSLLNTRNAALERIVEEQRAQSNEFEKLLSTMRVVPSHGSVGSHSVAIQSRGTQTEEPNDQEEEDDNLDIHQAATMTDDGTSRSMSPLSEINSTDDEISPTSWTELSEVDSKNDSLKHFPPSDDISDLSQTSTLEPMHFVWNKESTEETNIEANTISTQSFSIADQPPSTQLENIAAAESFAELRTPRVSNSAHPDRINRQQQPPEYNITLGVLSSPAPVTEASPMDRYAIEESSEFTKDRTKSSFDF